MSGAGDIRRYLRIMEGELLPMRQHTLRVNLDDYSLLRALLHLPAPDNFTSPNHFGKVGLLTFWDSVSYLDIKHKLEKFGVPFDEEDEGMTTYWDKELTPETEHPKSPYPSNSSIQTNWKDDTSKRPARKLSDRKSPALPVANAEVTQPKRGSTKLKKAV